MDGGVDQEEIGGRELDHEGMAGDSESCRVDRVKVGRI